MKDINFSWSNKDIHLKKEEGKEAKKEDKVVEKEEEKVPERKLEWIDIYNHIDRSLAKDVNIQINNFLNNRKEANPFTPPNIPQLNNSPVSDKQKEPKYNRLIVSLCSNGGSAYYGYLIDDLIKCYPSESIALCGGLNCSMATLLIAKRDLRLAWPNARFMIHDSWSYSEGTVYQIKEDLREYEDIRNRVLQDYMDYIGLTKKELDRILMKDTYFNGLDALNLGTKGLIDGIIIKALGDYKYIIRMRNDVQKTIDLYNDDILSIKDLTLANVTANK